MVWRLENSVKIEFFTALPEDLNTFKKLFINLESGDMINKDLFRKRILGLTSYFKC